MCHNDTYIYTHITIIPMHGENFDVDKSGAGILMLEYNELE